MPLMGGAAIYVAFVLSVLLFSPPFYLVELGAIVAGSTLLAWIGYLDDRKDLSPRIRLIVMAVAALVVALAGIQIRLFGTPLIDIPLTLFWIVALINAVNWIDKTVVEDDVARMMPVNAIEILAGETAELRPGGMHIMTGHSCKSIYNFFQDFTKMPYTLNTLNEAEYTMPYPAQIDRDTILTTARDLIEAKGLDALTLRTVATALGVKAPSLYRHEIVLGGIIEVTRRLIDTR